MTFLYTKKKNIYYSMLENKGLGASRVLTIKKKAGLNIRKSPLNVSTLKLNVLENFSNSFLLNKFYLKAWHAIRLFNINLKTYKAIRNKSGLPARGQRTQTNAKTKKKFKM